MAGEIIRYRRRELSLAPISEERRIMNETLARLRGNSSPTQLAPTRQERPLVICDDVVDLPRWCAVHDKPYLARYIRNGRGRYEYAQTFQFAESLAHQYQHGNRTASRVPVSDVAEESCPWCGANGCGSILCSECDTEVCYGRSTKRGDFRCRSSCDARGQLTNYRTGSMGGIKPSWSPNSGAFGGGR